MKIQITLQGTTPLIPQSDALVDPLNPIKRAQARITGKTKKTEEDHLELYRLDWIGALYYNEAIGPYIPSENIAASIRDGGKLTKLGTAVERALVMEPAPAPILYRGPRARDVLWQDESFRFVKSVVMQRNRVMRVRPYFSDWSLEAGGELLADLMDLDVFQKVCADAGRLVGIGTYRRGGYGRYVAKVTRK